MGTAFTIAGMAGTLAGILCTIQPALAGGRQIGPRSVAAARLGLVGPRTPRIGPIIVQRGGYTAITDMVRPRFVGGMIDIYPSTRTGFRFSLGDRYFAKTNFWRDAEQATHGLLFDARMVRFGIGLQRRVFMRRTPAALVGYDTEVAPGLVAGVEGGALFGRAINPGPRLSRAYQMDDQKQLAAGVNPVATLAVRYAF